MRGRAAGKVGYVDRREGEEVVGCCLCGRESELKPLNEMREPLTLQWKQ